MAVLLLFVAALITGCFGGSSGLSGGSGSSRDKAIVERRSAELLKVRSVEELQPLSDYLGDEVTVYLLAKWDGDEGEDLEDEETYTRSDERYLEKIYNVLNVESLLDEDLESFKFGDVVSRVAGRSATVTQPFNAYRSGSESTYRVEGGLELTWHKVRDEWQLVSITVSVTFFDTTTDSGDDGPGDPAPGSGSDQDNDHGQDGDGDASEHEIDFEVGKERVKDRMKTLGSLEEVNHFQDYRHFFCEVVHVKEIEHGVIYDEESYSFDDLIALRDDNGEDVLPAFFQAVTLLSSPDIFVKNGMVIYSIVWEQQLDEEWWDDQPGDYEWSNEDRIYGRLDFEWRFVANNWRLCGISYGGGTSDELKMW